MTIIINGSNTPTAGAVAVGDGTTLKFTAAGLSGQVLQSNGANMPTWVANDLGSVTSVAMTVPTGLSVTGSPITSSGTLAVSLQSGYSIPTTASQTNWDSAYTQRLQWDGSATNLVAATGRTSLALGTIATQDASSVAITGGSVTGITDLAVVDGGTGASNISDARTNLGAASSATTISTGTGLSGGGDLTANRTLSIANTAVTAGAFGSASDALTATVNAQGQLTALAAIPIAIANTQVSGLGTMSTQTSSGVTITGGSITGITDLAIADGGTGASDAPTARSNLGLGTAAVLTAGSANGVATLDAGGTVPLAQLPASIQGGVSYQGSWNAATNIPALTSSVGTKGFYYVVATSGTTNLNGITDWLVGDWAIFNGSVWEKIDNTDNVASVNGYTGVVVLAASDVGAPPTSRAVSAGTGLSGGGDLTTNRTISIANTAVTAASYGTASAVPSFTVNGQGQLTAASDVTIAIANTQVSGLGTMSTQAASNVLITGGSISGITDLAITDGGTGASTAQGAMNSFAGAVTSGSYLRGNGTNVVMNTIQVADVPTLNQNTTGTAANVTGTVALLNGGTGATTAPAARTALGATTLGSNLFTITNPSAITFPRLNADNTVSALDAPTFRGAIGAGTGNGSVTSITVTAGTGMSGGGTVSTSGTVTLTNAGVTSIGAGTGISVNASTGGVTVTNSGVTSVNGATGAVTVAAGSQAFVAFGSTGGY
jgi:hypothetical protein